MLLSGEREEQTRSLAKLLEGYETFLRFDLRELALIESLRTLRIMHHAAWIARRWHDPAFPLGFPDVRQHALLVGARPAPARTTGRARRTAAVAVTLRRQPASRSSPSSQRPRDRICVLRDDLLAQFVGRNRKPRFELAQRVGTGVRHLAFESGEPRRHEVRREQPIAPRDLTIDLGRNRVGVGELADERRADAQMHAPFAPADAGDDAAQIFAGLPSDTRRARRPPRVRAPSTHRTDRVRTTPRPARSTADRSSPRCRARPCDTRATTS